MGQSVVIGLLLIAAFFAAVIYRIVSDLRENKVGRGFEVQLKDKEND